MSIDITYGLFHELSRLYFESRQILHLWNNDFHHKFPYMNLIKNNVKFPIKKLK